MKATKLIIKRKDNGKHVVNKRSLDQSRLRADYLKSVGKGGGIVDTLLPSTQLEQSKLDSLKQTYIVDEVVGRDKQSRINQNIREYFNNDAFIVALGEWWRKCFTGGMTIDRISIELSEVQKWICEEVPTEPKQVQLKNIFMQYAPELLNCPRENQWWEAQITKRRKSLKIK
jgi:hypothetical protein